MKNLPKLMLYLISAFTGMITIFLFTASINSQPTQEWVRRFSDTASVSWSASNIKLDGAGNIYVDARTSNKFGFAKYDPSGNLLTVASHWPAGYESGGGTCFDVANNGDVYITGSVSINISSWIYTVKFNTNGIFQWGKIYNLDNNDFSNDIKIDKLGNIIVCGSASSGSTDYALILKYNPIGDTIWTRRFINSTNSSLANSIALDSLNNIYISGKLTPPQSILAIKYSSEGNVVWYTTYVNTPPRANTGHGIALDNLQNIYLVGVESVPFSGFNNILLKISNNGIISWSRVFKGIINGEGRNAGIPVGPVISSGGDFIYYSTQSANGMGGGSNSISTIKYNSLGDSQWVKSFGGGIPGSNFTKDIKLDKSDNIYVLGTGYFSTTSYDFVLIKYLETGVQQWVSAYTGIITNNNDYAGGLILDSNLNVYVTGASQGNPGVAVTIKYSQPLGIISWSNEIPGRYGLEQNYPNPFNPYTKIRYHTAENNSYVVLEVYDISGKTINVLVNRKQNKGTYEAYFNGEKLSSGVYFYSLSVNGTIIDTKKMIYIR